MHCEMCGKEGELSKTEVEGVILKLCEKCSKYGHVIERAKPIPKKIKQVIVQKPQEEEIIFVIVPDYAKKIKQQREKLNLIQKDFSKLINEKESLISKIESGTVEPSIGVARKLEKFLKIRLVEEHKEESRVATKTKDNSLTIGDLIKT